jgi:hypothetical protein
VTNRVADYCGFAVRFIGLGYLALWPFSTPDPFGLAQFCRPDTPFQYLFYHWPQFVHLTPGLHLIGILCAGFLAARLLLRQSARWRRGRPVHANADLASSACDPSVLARLQRAQFAKPPPKVKPRSEFGLRGSARRVRDSSVDLPTRRPKVAAKLVERN